MSKKFAIPIGIIITFFACFGVAQATHTFNEDIFVPSLKVGSQGVGGVTFFNGTIINTTTDSNGAGQPVTFGDDVRIDGAIFRTEAGGTNPLKLSDSVRPTTDATYDLGETNFTFDDLYLSGEIVGNDVVSTDNIIDDTIVSADIADGTITSADINNGTIVSADIADGTITSADINNGTIVSADINNGTIVSEDISNGTIAREDIADDAINGAKISNLADLTINTLTTGGDINGVDITTEVSVYYDTDDNADLTVPASNPTTSKMVIGSTKMTECDKDGLKYASREVTLPFAFTSNDTYIVNATGFGWLVPFYESVAVYKSTTDFDSFFIMVHCEDLDVAADITVDWMAIGY